MNVTNARVPKKEAVVYLQDCANSCVQHRDCCNHIFGSSEAATVSATQIKLR